MAVRRLIQLNNGAWMPTLGFGTYLITEPDQCRKVMETALRVGYRHFDTALSYENELHVGAMLNKHIAEQTVKRNELFVTTKVPPVYLSPQDVLYSAEKSLSHLRLSYVDLILIHNPFGRHNHDDGNLKTTNRNGEPDHCHHDLVRAWQAFEDLVDRGLAKAIGVSNFTPSQIDRIWQNARIKPANVQAECHCYYQQQRLREFCAQRGIVLTGYAPIGAPGRLDRQRHSGDCKALEDPIVLSLAAKHRKKPGQIILRYLLQLGVVPLPKSTSAQRIKENIELYDFELGTVDTSELARMNTDHKFFRFLSDVGHPEYRVDELF